MRARRGANGAKVEGLDRGVRGWGGECTRRAFRGLACNRARVSAWPWHPHTYRIPLDSAGRFPSRSREDCPSMLNEPINIDANNWRRDCHRSEGCLRTLDTVSPRGQSRVDTRRSLRAARALTTTRPDAARWAPLGANVGQGGT